MRNHGMMRLGHLGVIGGLIILSGAIATGQAMGQTTAPADEPTNYQPPPTMDAGAMPPYAANLLPQRADLQEDPATVAQQVSCVIQIDGPANIGTTNWPTAGYGGYVQSAYYGSAPDSHFAAAVVTSTEVIDAAAATVGIMPQQRAAQVRVHGTAIGPQLLRLEVDLHRGPAVYADGTAQKLAEKLCDQLKQAFRQSADARNYSLQTQVSQNEVDLAALEKQLADTRARLRADSQQTTTMPTMYGDVSSTLANTRSQRQQTATMLEQNRTRLAALEPASSSALISEWDALVTQDQQRLQELTAAHAAGNASDAQVKDAQARLTDAQTHLAAAKLQSDASSDNNRSYRNQEVANLKSTIAENESRLKQLDDTINQLSDPEFLKTLDEQRELQTLEQGLVNRVAELQSRIAQTAAPGSNSATVTLTVLDGKAK